jgi:CBS-domain-containing membrane protein
MLVMGVSAIFVHLVSPLRDPAFQPNSANAGTLVRELQGVSEAHWVQAAVILAGLLATNFTLVLWKLRIWRDIGALVILGLVMWYLLYFVFLLYLLGQWIVD